MGLFRLFRGKRHQPPSPAPPAAPVSRPAPRKRREPWLDHGLHHGAHVPCARCDRRLRVALQSPSSVTVSHDGALDGIVLVCADCGRLLCATCALAASDNPYLPRCDGCRGNVTLPMSR
ncbi:hypothetical protein SAMN06297387_116145 [Streptomyces zhaozhouensis]|uniref:Uncharacterized protein n=1 Tax=Streptomyces zhaozhouensis TaxID=1300267 RepID=A0A286E0J1_9ACTN|nr:hypothetical protein [Streptomyces zhaozhouensis]SOD64421.1 hypothetical protein SAMN06297387_116145 [Streptomyces zhaozhouensis]